MTRSQRNALLEQVEDPRILSKKAGTPSEAKDWGKLAAALGWGLDDLEAEVEPTFHQVAIDAYNRRIDRLIPCPF